MTTALLATVRGDIERNALRVRNGVKYLFGGRFGRGGAAPRELVWSRGKTRLWRYGERRSGGLPLLTFVGLVGRAGVFDLHPANSFVGSLLRAGFDPFVLDWGEPDEADSENTLATYTLDHLPRAVEAVLEASGAPDLTIIGYCMGACLTLTSLGAGAPLPLRSLVLLAPPIDFSKMGAFMTPIRDGSIDPAIFIDESGNVPGSLVLSAFAMRRPTSRLVLYANLLENLWSDRFMEGFQAINEWAGDPVPLPGAALREVASQWLVGNGFVNGTLRAGSRTVDLSNIRCPVLSVIADHDDLVPPAASEALASLLTNTTVETIHVAAGHMNLVMGRPAEKVTIPAIVDFVKRDGIGAAA